MKILFLLILFSCSHNKPKEVDPAIFYKNYKSTLSQCTDFILDNPSNDVLRFAKADDRAVGKVMDGEILKCLDFNMELIYEKK